MPKTYNHITLPKQLIKSSTPHSYTRKNRLIQDIPKLEDVKQHRENLALGFSRLSNFQTERLETTGEIPEQVDMKIRFRGVTKSDFLERYNAQVYQKYDDTPENQTYSNDVVIAKISTEKPNGRKTSDYEHFQNELKSYVEKGELKSYFDYIDSINPLSLDEIAEPELYDEISKTTSERLVDVVFGSGDLISSSQLNLFSSLYRDKIFVTVNSVGIHYYRMSASKATLESITKTFSGVISVEKAPIVTFSSGQTKKMESYDIRDNTSSTQKPVLLIDTAINDRHPILATAALKSIGDTAGDKSHGTNVGSLIACGQNISATRIINVENRIQPITAFIDTPYGQTINEQLIEDALKQSYSKTSATIANLSINSYKSLPPFSYTRKTVNKMSVLFDRWARKYNALFTISVGNLFNNWPASLRQEVIRTGYPTYFDLEQTCILPPSDSINNLAVGSVVYGASPDSIADSKDPSPITRRDFIDRKNNFSVKPDIVQYDSNFDMNFICEENGPYMASEDGNLMRGAGTSYAAPLSAFNLGCLAKKYPSYNANSLKALILHFSESLGSSKKITNNDMLLALTGHGMPDLDKALSSLSYSTTMVIEDSIQINHKKLISIPIPATIAGSSRLRLGVKTTLVYNPPVNDHDLSIYNPIVISARLVRSDGKEMSNFTTQKSTDGAHRKSNVKTYEQVTKNTIKHMGEMWALEVIAEPAAKSVTDDITQDYSIVVTVDDLEQSDEIDIYQDIVQMINVEVENTVDISVSAT